MLGFSRLTRIAAAGALVLSALAVGAAPSGADSAAPAGTAAGSFTDNANGTVTVTYSDLTLPQVNMYTAGTTCSDTGGVPPGPLHLIGGGADYPLAASPATLGTTSNVWSLGDPPPGSPLPAGTYTFCLYDITGPSAYNLISDGGDFDIYAPTTASFVQNPDDTITLTYANAKKNPDDTGEFVNLLLWPSIAACPAAPDPTPGFVLSTSGGGIFMPPSPAVIGVGTPVVAYPPTALTTTPLPAGYYQTCLYVGSTLQQSGSVGAKPVTPSFTG